VHRTTIDTISSKLSKIVCNVRLSTQFYQISSKSCTMHDYWPFLSNSIKCFLVLTTFPSTIHKSHQDCIKWWQKINKATNSPNRTKLLRHPSLNYLTTNILWPQSATFTSFWHNSVSLLARRSLKLTFT